MWMSKSPDFDSFVRNPSTKVVRQLPDALLYEAQRYPVDGTAAGRMAKDELARRIAWRRPEGWAIYVSGAAAIISVLSLAVSIYVHH